MKQTKNLKILDSGNNYELAQIGYEIAEYSSLRRPDWFIVEYPCQGGCPEGECRFALLWLQDKSQEAVLCQIL